MSTSLTPSEKSSEEKLWPEAQTTKLAMDAALIETGPRLRDHYQLTNDAATALGKEHTEMLTSIVSPENAGQLHKELVSGLTHPPLTEKDVDDRVKRMEAERKQTIEKGRAQHTWAFEKVQARAKQNVESKPGLVKLLQDSGLVNSWRFWGPVWQKARLQLQREKIF